MLIIENQYTDIAISQVVRIINSIASERDYIQSQLGSKAEYIDIEARNMFYEGPSPALLKCTSKFIYYGK